MNCLKGINNCTRKCYDEIAEKSKQLEASFLEAGRKYDIASVVNRVGSILSAFFTPDDVFDFRSAVKSDTKKFTEYFKGMSGQGIYIAPSQFEAMFVSFAHSDEDIKKTIKCIENTFSGL